MVLRTNCLLKHVIVGGIEETERQGRRRNQLLDDLKEKRGYWKLKKKAFDCCFWRNRFGRDYGAVVRETAESMHLVTGPRVVM
jgi:hypothetical protein